MLTNLDWLTPGQPFPPSCECERLDTYHRNRELFEAEHGEVYKEDLKRIERVIGNFGEIISYPVVLNFQKLMSLKIADLLLGEPFKMSGPEDTAAAVQPTIDTIQRVSDLQQTAYMAALDVSRYGDGLFLVRKDGDHGIIDLTQPPIWYPVVDETNIRSVLYHVLAWRVDRPASARLPKQAMLMVQIHGRGTLETRTLRLVDTETKIAGVIGDLVETTGVLSTGLSDFAVIPVSNTLTSDRVTGIDDYTDVDSIIAELIVRVGQVARILDKHASPSMTGPMTALEKDPNTGEWHLKSGKYFPRMNDQDPAPEYMTWDGQLTPSFTLIEKLVNLLYTVSEMGSAVFGDLSAQGGQIPSGSALRRLMVSPLAKVARVRGRFDKALKKAVALCSELGGREIVRIAERDISITWQDGLPADPVEEADIMMKRTANKATMSVKRALMTYDGMTDDKADEELAVIADEDAAATPVSGGGLDPFAAFGGGGQPSPDVLAQGAAAQPDMAVPGAQA